MPYNAFMSDMLGVDRRINKNNPTYQELKKGIIPSEPARLKMLNGSYPHRSKGIESGGASKMYDKSRYKFFIDAPFAISSKCCNVMKKYPARKYAKETGRKPMTAQMASESRMRTQKWLQNGCNGFEMKSPISNPMAFWTEQDVLTYIYENKIPIASVYGKVVVESSDSEQIEGQMNISDYGIFDKERPLLKTTGCNRTGCMFCAYGVHRETYPNRFERMKETHPKQYEYIMKPIEEGGLNYKEVIDWINENGNMDIRY